jgi:DNA polymerase III subunit alpha
MIPVEGVKPVSITKALADEPRLREAAKEEVVGRLLDYAAAGRRALPQRLHPRCRGGDRRPPADQLVPLYRDPRSDMPATQFNMKWVEAAGLVKFDFLGLKTLTVIQNAMDLLALRGISFDINLIPWTTSRVTSFTPPPRPSPSFRWKARA